MHMEHTCFYSFWHNNYGCLLVAKFYKMLDHLLMFIRQKSQIYCLFVTFFQFTVYTCATVLRISQLYNDVVAIGRVSPRMHHAQFIHIYRTIISVKHRIS